MTTMEPNNQTITNTTPENKELTKIEDMTLKQKKWLQSYIKSGNATQAAKDAGYQCENEHSYAVIGTENLRKLDISEFLEEMGLTDRALIAQVAQGIAKPTKMEKTKQYEGGAADFREVPDYGIRYKFLELALKLKKRITGDTPNGNVQNNIGDMTVQIVNYADTQKVVEVVTPAQEGEVG